MAKYKAATVADALTKARGVVSHAARLLDCDRTTVYAYINRYPTVAQARDDAREDLLDYVENKLLEQITEGNMTAIIFYLKTQGRHRGYVERMEHAGHDGGELTIKVTHDADSYG
jgi:hypothetical protein